MDVLLEIAIFLAKKWRFTLTAIGTIILAIGLAGNVGWFTGLYAGGLAFAGCVVGFIWQATSESFIPGSPRKKRKL